MSGIEDKVVVITGASSGIGEATALLLAERGGKVVLGARGAGRLEALAARIADAGGDAAYARTDVRRRGDLSDLVKLACERYGKLDVLVNNAGVMPISPLDDKFAMPPDAIARAIAFAIEQPADVDVSEIVVRPTAQS
jgi:NADP-dependent 3-hydroxy acid dehydrogenase YdfG